MLRFFLVSLFFEAALIAAAQSSGGAVAAGYAPPASAINVAPGQVITFFVHGIGSAINAPVRATSLPLPTVLAGISADFVQIGATPTPILAVEPIPTCSDMRVTGCGSYTAITVQIPFLIQASNPTTTMGAPIAGAHMEFLENGNVASSVDVIPFVDEIHLLRSCDAIFP